jgi:flagellar motor switch protein FliM
LSPHEYTSQEALDLLLKKLSESDESLLQDIEESINFGKDVQKEDRNFTGRVRTYRKIEPLSAEEALIVAFKALRAYFLEISLIIESANDNFVDTVSAPTNANIFEDNTALQLFGNQWGQTKNLELEMTVETQITPSIEEILTLKPENRDLISQQRENLKRLEGLINFIRG